MRHLLITGLPGVGKTTLLRVLGEQLRSHHPAGFVTEEVRDAGRRTGFRLVTLDGRMLMLAHVDYPGSQRVSRYGVDVRGFERLLRELDLPRCAARVILIDEIGKMECLSPLFVEQIGALLDSSRIVVATIALKGTEPIERIKRRPDCRLVTVTHENRDRLCNDLATAFRGLLAQRAQPID